MAHDEFRIRIKKDGTIHFYSQDLGEERMRVLREMLEDSLGPVQQREEVSEGDTPPPGVGKVDEEKQEELRRGR